MRLSRMLGSVAAMRRTFTALRISITRNSATNDGEANGLLHRPLDRESHRDDQQPSVDLGRADALLESGLVFHFRPLILAGLRQFSWHVISSLHFPLDCRAMLGLVVNGVLDFVAAARSAAACIRRLLPLRQVWPTFPGEARGVDGGAARIIHA